MVISETIEDVDILYAQKKYIGKRVNVLENIYIYGSPFTNNRYKILNKIPRLYFKI